MAAAGQELTPTSYIGHHLTNRTVSLGDGAFWTLHLDTFATALMLGVVGFGFLWWIVRGATAGVPNKRQAFVELLFDFISASKLNQSISLISLKIIHTSIP